MNIIQKLIAGLSLVGELAQVAMDIRAGNLPRTEGLSKELYRLLTQSLGLKLKHATQGEFQQAVQSLMALFF